MTAVRTLEKFGFGVDYAQADVVVVGGGGAASRAAVSAAQSGAKVLMLAKAPVGQGGSTVHGASEIMSMGASGYGSPDDSATVHYEDTMRPAAGFIDRDLVRVLAEDAPKRIADLIELGVPFDRVADGYKLIRSDFGSYARALGVKGKTGKAFVGALAEQGRKLGVETRQPAALIDLLRDSTGRVSGVVAMDLDSRRLLVVAAGAVVLGTGGAHGLFSQQVSTAEMTGDGQAICFRHGAELVNMEFHQFGPAMVHPYVQLFSKSCFILHPKMLNRDGHEFLPDYLPRGVTPEAAMDEKVFPFTISNESRYIDIAIATEIAQGRGTERGAVHFSFADIAEERLAATIPNTMRWMRAKGLDPKRDLLDVGIAFQCLNGGVRMTNTDAMSTIEGLFVIGELAGGVRGPDRPGGNSLAEGQVFGHRAGVGAAAYARGSAAPGTSDVTPLARRLEMALKPNASFDARRIASDLRAAMQAHCLVEKTESGLNIALAAAREAHAAFAAGGGATPPQVIDALTIDNMATTADVIVQACIERRESRSSHYRTDFPERDDARFSHALTITRGEADPFRLTYDVLDYPRPEFMDTSHSQAANHG
ncbi:FAD-binding protein [Paraburkholderia youngii]|uniref:Fumarate reductase (CoM/CoB) subunit A n=1 Tax=Paraburkholderia youngii TaxID=2782701 RepID=A0A7W8LD78_9BURK|nr:FAD-binding protein [Paraburkholderia youngii]MBB5404862.1 fumarate reductase (CoM/CoB) subunit A [Paraburkholderia youngii]